MKEYYTAERHLRELYDKLPLEYAFKADTVAEYRLWKKKLWARLAELTGIFKMNYTDPASEVLEVVKKDGYSRIKMLIQTGPDIWMPFYILIPGDIEEDERRPAVIALHGHGSGGKYAVAGLTDIPGIKDTIERYNYDYGLKMVRAGYITFCPDARGFGERREREEQGGKPADVLNSSCKNLSNLAAAMGQSLTGMWVWDLMRLLDFVEEYKYVDKDKIAVSGFSGGGMLALWLAAMDERIKAAVIAGYFHGFKETIFHSNRCSCNFVPGLWECCDIGDLAAMIAPRPILIKTGYNDKLNGRTGLDNVYSQTAITRSAYQLLGAEEKFHHHVFEGGHIWNEEKVYEFLDEFLN